MLIDLSAFFNKYQFKKNKKIYYGYFENHFISFIEKGNYIKLVYNFSFPLDSEKCKSLSSGFSRENQNYRSLIYARVSSINVEILLFQGSDLPNDIENILKSIFLVVDKYVDNNTKICPICGKQIEEEGTLLKIKESVIKIHHECYETLLSDAEKLNEKTKKVNNKTIKKSLIINSLVFLFSILLSFVLGFSVLYNYMVFLVPVLYVNIVKAFYFRHKVFYNLISVKVLTIFTILVTILACLIGNISYFTVVVKDLSLIDSFKNYFNILFSTKKLLTNTVVNLIYSLLMASIFIVSNIKKCKDLTINGVELL